MFNALCIFLPSSNFVPTEFDELPFVSKDGTEYYSYKYWIGLGIVLNSVLTYGAEILSVNVLTKKYEIRSKQRRAAAFVREMEGFRLQEENS